MTRVLYGGFQVMMHLSDSLCLAGGADNELADGDFPAEGFDGFAIFGLFAVGGEAAEDAEDAHGFDFL